MNPRVGHAFALSLTIAAFASAVGIAACSSSDVTAPDASSADGAGEASATGDGAVAPADAGPDVADLDATCDARIVECTSKPTQTSPTINVPAACGAPAYDSYATPDSNEQVAAACNDFCIAQNPDYADAGGFVGCNQTTAEQSIGTGAFHCVCAP